MMTLLTNSSIKPLRKCVDCGLEATTEEELKNFTKDNGLIKGRRNLCKQCSNIRSKNHLKTPRGSLVSRYSHMIERCYYVSDPRYKDYGGRGITVCEEWKSNRENFINWAIFSGYKYELTLDRIDNDAGYSPNNCRWVTIIINSRNKRNIVTNFESKTRVCEKCKIEKPLTEFHKDNKLSSNHVYVCKSCRSTELKTKIQNKNEIQEKQLQETIDPFLNKLTCIVCGETKTTRHFHRRHASKTGFFKICKVCRRKQRKLERLKNK